MNASRPFFKTLSLGAFLFGALQAVVACGTQGNDVPIGSDNQPISCATDANCPAGKTCQDNVCKPPPSCVPQAETCNGIDDDCNGQVDEGALCPMGQLCHQGACAAAPACTIDTDCPMGQICHEGACAPHPPPACSADSDCPMGQVCHQGVCAAPPPPACMTDADCPPGHACQNGMCVSQGCMPVAEICDGIDNDCDGQVDNAALCPMGQVCHNGACTLPPPACMADIDCPMGQVCIAGACHAGPPPACVADSDCPMGQVCHNGA
jgi:Cys-rich repeat protein